VPRWLVAQSECSVLKRKWNAEKYAMQRHDCCAATSGEGKANKNIYIYRPAGASKLLLKAFPGRAGAYEREMAEIREKRAGKPA